MSDNLGELGSALLFSCLNCIIQRTKKLYNLLVILKVNVFRDSLDQMHTADLTITSLDLSYNGLDDKEMTTLCNILYRATSLQHLNLAGSKFTDRGLTLSNSF